MKRWILLLLAVALCFSGCDQKKEKKSPEVTYTATFSMYITSRTSEQLGYSSSDQATSQRLVVTCEYIIKSDVVLDQVAAQIGREDLDANALRDMIQAESSDAAEVLHVRVTHREKKLALEIAQALAEVAPGALMEIVSGSSVKLLDMPRQAVRNKG